MPVGLRFVRKSLIIHDVIEIVDACQIHEAEQSATSSGAGGRGSRVCRWLFSVHPVNLQLTKYLLQPLSQVAQRKCNHLYATEVYCNRRYLCCLVCVCVCARVCVCVLDCSFVRPGGAWCFRPRKGNSGLEGCWGGGD